jgi:16S rRNA (guanine527-N7)-methyltransferase
MDFAKTLSAWGIDLSPTQIQQFETYYRLLVEWNARFNLTAVTARDEVYAKHFADSLAGLPYMVGSVCDVGAGAGFPSLALAIADPTHGYTLLDSVNKKITFQREVIAQLALLQVQALHVRAEDAGKGALRETFDTVTARAVAPIGTLLEYLCPLAKVGGRVVVYKTDAAEELALAKHAMQVLHLTLAETHPYHIDDAARCILVFVKTAPTPAAYPRGGNKPRTMPL